MDITPETTDTVPTIDAPPVTEENAPDTTPAEPVVEAEPLLLASPQPTTTTALPVRTMPTLPQLGVALGGLALIFAFSYFPGRASIPMEQSVSVAPTTYTDKRDTDTAAFSDVTITAQAAYVWDVKNQRALYNKNAGKRMPLASLTKLMTALVASEHLAPDTQIPITPDALAQEGDSLMMPGETFTLHALTHLTLITSSNDGAYALAAAVQNGLAHDDATNTQSAFIAAMNAKAEEIGLSQSYFTNPTGLDVDGTTSGSYGSARDMTFLMEYLMRKHPEILDGTAETVSTILDQEGISFQAVNTNELTARIPGLIGSKTGFTTLAGGNLVIAYDAGLNRPIIISVLGSTREGRFDDILTLITETAHALENEQ